MLKRRGKIHLSKGQRKIREVFMKMEKLFPFSFKNSYENERQKKTFTIFLIPYVSDVFPIRSNTHHNNLEVQTNPLLQPLLQPVNTARLKRCWSLDLQGAWRDIAGWITYHDFVIHGIVAYCVSSAPWLINFIISDCYKGFWKSRCSNWIFHLWHYLFQVGTGS